MKTTRLITQLFSALSLLIVLSVNPFAAPGNVGVSDQKAGSVLVFPYYKSDGLAVDTRITISNTGATTTRVHLFFVDAACAQADMPICLTANASTSFLVSEMDPSNTGYLIAVAIDENGCPIPQNGLIGNAFVNDGNYVGNYGAEAFWAYGTNTQMATCDMVNMVSTLNFNVLNCVGTGLDALPSQFVAEIQSPNDSVGQKLVTVGLTGDIANGVASTGATQAGIGLAFNDLERQGSFSNSPWMGSCQKSFIIDLRTPRVPGGLGKLAGVNNPALVPTGRTGTLKWNVEGAVGLIMTPPTGTNRWSGIRTLHKTNAAVGALIIPVSPANCVAGLQTP